MTYHEAKSHAKAQHCSFWNDGKHHMKELVRFFSFQKRKKACACGYTETVRQ